MQASVLVRFMKIEKSKVLRRQIIVDFRISFDHIFVGRDEVALATRSSSKA